MNFSNIKRSQFIHIFFLLSKSQHDNFIHFFSPSLCASFAFASASFSPLRLADDRFLCFKVITKSIEKFKIVINGRQANGTLSSLLALSQLFLSQSGPSSLKANIQLFSFSSLPYFTFDLPRIEILKYINRLASLFPYYYFSFLFLFRLRCAFLAFGRRLAVPWTRV